MRMFVMLCVTLLLASMPATLRADVTISSKRQTPLAICVPARVMEPDSPTMDKLRGAGLEAERQRIRLRESVKDLARCIEKICGAKAEVVVQPSGEAAIAKFPDAVLVAELAEQVYGKPKQSADFKQGFRYVVKKSNIGFIGESDLATSYAIYEMLDRVGARWYMPGDLGECLPTLKEIKLDDVDFSSAPGTVFRSIWYCDDAYRRRNRHGGLLLNAGHALENSWINAEDRKAHPEWRATIDGKVQEHRLKWSNKQLPIAIADKIIAAHAASPEPTYSLSPDDGMGYDNSPEDRALDGGDFDTSIGEISITDRLMALCNPIAERVTAKYPDVKFGMLAYANYTRPPVREKVHPAIVPQIAPITYSRAHPMNMMEVPGNKDLKHIVEGWAKMSKQTSYYFYGWFLAEPVAPNPMLTKWGHDVPYVLKEGKCVFWQPETTANFESSMQALYLGCRLAWNPKLKSKDVLDEINVRFYGNAAKEMAAYWQFIDDLWVKIPEYSGCGFAYLRRFTPENMAKARQLMDKAIAAAKTAEEKGRIGLADDSLRLFDEFMKLRVDQAEGRFADLGPRGEAWMKKIIELGEKYKDNYAFGRMPWTPRTLGGAYFGSFYGVTYTDASRVAKDFKIISPSMRNWKWQADEKKDGKAPGEVAGWAAPAFDDKAWKTTDVAVETWSALGYHDYFKSMWYRSDVKLEAVPAGKKVYLWIGSTDGSAKVFVNGKHVPYVAEEEQPDKSKKLVTKEEFNGYCQPASWDITSALDPSGNNKVAILTTRTFINELGTGGLLSPVVIYRDKD